MKLHSDVHNYSSISRALLDAQNRGQVAADVHMVIFVPVRSRSHRYGFEIQLGTYNKTSGPANSRHYKNSGTYGASNIYAATYDEWGWFLAEVFAQDPDAIFGPYKGRDDFNTRTHDAYPRTRLVNSVPTGGGS